MSTNVNHRYIGGSSNVNVDNKSFSKDVPCLITLSKTDFIDKNRFRRLSLLEVHVYFNFLSFVNNFKYVVIKADNILKKSDEKMRCILSLNTT